LTSIVVESTLEGIVLSPAIAADGWLSVPSGVAKKMLTQDWSIQKG